MIDAAAAPVQLGRYRLIERLATGGMAEIWRAYLTGSRGIERQVAIKRILPQLAREPEFVEMFIDEARLMVQLDHPKIVRVMEFSEENQELFMALELIDGFDALALLRGCSRKQVRLPPPLAIFIVTEVLDALDYAHNLTNDAGKPLELVHRDISPSNIFIAKRGYVKLGDFGIARVAEGERAAKTQGAALKGKYGYMAPEQVVGAAVDARADVFAVGIVLSEMLMGRRLFTAPNDLDVLLMVRDANLDRLDRYGADLPPDLRQILDSALARAPQARFATAAAFRDALLEWLFGGRHRVGHGELARFLETVPVERPAPRPDNAAPSSGTQGAGIDGPATNAAREKAASMQQSIRRAVAEQQPGGASESSAIVIELDTPRPESVDTDGGREEREETPVEVARAIERALGAEGADQRPDLVGDLVHTSTARLFTRLAAELETGLLVVESGDVVKEIFLVRGVPEYVTSNAPQERLGEYLVAHGVISTGELSMVLAILPRFNGKLGDTLVGLGLLRPLEVFRHLSRQVRDKLIDVFGWTHGSYKYLRGRVNSREAFPLRLDPWEILGAAVAALPLEPLRERLLPHADLRVRKVERLRPTPEEFRLGTGPRELWGRLDGKRTVGEWLKRYEQPEQHLTLCRTLYLLIETELAAIE